MENGKARLDFMCEIMSDEAIEAVAGATRDMILSRENGFFVWLNDSDLKRLSNESKKLYKKGFNRGYWTGVTVTIIGSYIGLYVCAKVQEKKKCKKYNEDLTRVGEC